MIKFYQNRCVLLCIVLLLSSGICQRVSAGENLSPDLVTNAQNPASKRISGIVTDESGATVVGITVVQQDTTNGVVTDATGRYSLQVPAGAMLIFSGLGYVNREITVTEAMNVYDITMNTDATQIDQVVVIGYGTVKKVNLTGAVDVIGEEELADRPVPNIAQAIQGRIPNVNITFTGGQPGQGGNINVRGLSSINGGSPLILIDGVPGDINRINSNDVASISVLKDAAASAIYGARAAFGVILVTTKSAKEGKTTITYNGFVGVSAPTVSTDFDTNGYRTTLLNDIAFERQSGNTYTRYSVEDMAELKARENDVTEHPDRPWVVVKDYNGRRIYNYYGNWDWWHTFFNDNPVSHSHSVNASGGNDKMNFMISGKYYTKDGLMKINPDKFHSFNFRSKVSAKLFSFLTLTNNTSYYDDTYDYHGVRSGGSHNADFVNVTVHALPAYAPFNPDGTSTFRTLKNTYSIGDGHQAVQADPNRRGRNKNHEFQTSTALVFQPIDELTVNVDYTYNQNMVDNWYRAAVVQYSIEPGVLEDVAGFNIDQYFKNMSFDPRHVANAYVNYTDRYGKHNLAVTAGMNYEDQSHASLSAQRNDLLSQTLNDLNLATGDMSVGGGSRRFVTLSAFFRAAYNFDERYLMEVNGRYDGSSRFKKEGRWGFFPSVSAAWRISQENFFDGISHIVSNAKIRASYGSLGNQNTSNYYPYISSLGKGQSDWLVGDGRLQTVSVPNPIAFDLTWEETTAYNVGLDLGFLRDRLSFTGEFYIQDITGMLAAGPELPTVYGATPPQQNSGSKRVTGWELSLSWNDRLTVGNKPFRYEVFATLADAKSKITKFNNPNKLLNQNYVGREEGEIWGLKVAGYFDSDEEAANWHIDQSAYGSAVDDAAGEWAGLKGGDVKFVDLNGDGRITQGKNTLDDPGDFVRIGNSSPRYSYSFGANLNWNGIDLSAFFQGIGKRNWFPGQNADKFWGPFSRPYYSFLPKGFMEMTWSEDNKDSFLPILRGYTALGGNRPLGVPSDKWLQNIGYLRLKNITVGYTLPERLSGKVGLTQCRIYFSGDNVFTWTPLRSDYIDPEQPVGDSANGRVYPFSRTFSLGLDLTF